MGKRTGKLKKAAGWLLSLMMILAFYSPQAAALRQMPSSLRIAAGQELCIQMPFPLQVKLSAPDAQALSDTGETLHGRGVQQGSVTVSLLGIFPLKKAGLEIQEELVLYPGGQAVGVALKTQGVLVVGTSDLTSHKSPARLAGIRAGDVITEAGGQAVTSAGELTALVARYGGKPLPLVVQRGNDALQLTLQPQKDGASGNYRIGAWVRDSTAGVGTLSFYGKVGQEEPLRYAALGHAITDADTQQILSVSEGELMEARVVDVRKGQVGTPGELKGSFLQEHKVLGNIRRNNEYGIYGLLEGSIPHPLYPNGLPIGGRDAVHTGKASILCTVDATGMKEYEIEIVQTARQNSKAQRSMVLQVTDPALLQKTGGIVQGMSGSPILQDGRIVGAVTHVFVNDPTMGYGLYIDWMLEEAGGI